MSASNNNNNYMSISYNSFKELNSSIEAFKKNDPVTGFKYFNLFRESVGPNEMLSVEGKIYHKHWKAIGRPSKETHPTIAHNNFGELAFHNQKDFSTPNRVKAQTLEAFLKGFVKHKLLDIAAQYRKNPDLAHKEFQELINLTSESEFLKKVEQRIYYKLWEAMGKPTIKTQPDIAHDDFGRLAFHHVLNRTSPDNKKAEALEACAKELKSNPIPLSDRKNESLDKLKALNSASLQFYDGNKKNGFEYFDLFRQQFFSTEELKQVEAKIYKRLWKKHSYSAPKPNEQFNHPEYGELAFHDQGLYGSTCSTKHAVLQGYLKNFIRQELKIIAAEFRAGKPDNAQKDFEILMQLTTTIPYLDNVRKKIYEKMWMVMGRPPLQPNSSIAKIEYGKLTFHDLTDKQSSTHKKAEAIEAFTRSVKCSKNTSESKLEFRAQCYYKTNGPVVPVDTNHISPTSGQDLLGKLLDEFDGVGFGENHYIVHPKEYIIKNMEFFKNKGVTTLFMEAPFTECMQDDLDFYHRERKLSYQLDECLSRSDRMCNFTYPNSYMGLLGTAYKYGIRVVAIDTKAAKKENNLLNPQFNTQLRMILMNDVAVKIVLREKGNGKYIALMGTDHLSNHSQEVSGVCEMLGIPSIKISELESDEEIQKNAIHTGTISEPVNMRVNFELFRKRAKSS